MVRRTFSLPPRGLLTLIVGVTVMPLATLLWLGWRLLEQDRALEAQQIQQRLDRSADLVVAAIERSLSAWEQRLAAGVGEVPGNPGDVVGAVSVTMRREGVLVTPRSRVAFLPAVPALPEPPASAFAAGDEAEYRAHDLRAAAAAFLTLTRSVDHPTRAGALLRLARTQQNLGQTDAALATYTTLLGVDDVGIGGAPAALVARYARCQLFEARGRPQELAADAADLLRDLRAARWPLTAPMYWLYLDDAVRWTGTALETTDDKQRLAGAVAALRERPWAARLNVGPGSGLVRQPDSGRDLLDVDGESIAVLWHSTPDSVSALLATPAFAQQQWLAAAEGIAREQQIALTVGSSRAGRSSMMSPAPPVSPPAQGPPASISTTAVAPAASAPPPAPAAARSAASPSGAAITRNAAQTGLPWSISVAPADPDARQSEFVLRRQFLVAGFLLLVSMALAAGYVIVRAVSRELAVARLQSDFVAAVSHEFRTPLTTLRQFTDMLRDKAVLTDERRRICYDAQSRATDRLTRLVESLLDFGRLEAGAHPYTFESHDVTTIVGALVEDFRIDANAAGYDVRFQGNGAAPTQVDRDAFSRAIWNLLDNAVKYSPGADTVEVDVHRDGHDVVIAVRDHGLGISADEQAAIFTKFHRGAEARARGIRGTGLGLAMVDEIVKAHHGRVEVDSEPGQGSTFSIHLPAERSA